MRNLEGQYQAAPRKKLGCLSLVALLPLALMGGFFAYVQNQTGGLGGAVHSLLQGKKPGIQWEGTGRAIFHDIDGDGIPEAFGRARHATESNKLTLVAVDTTTGKPLWKGEPIGTFRDTTQGRLSVVDGVVLYGSHKGEVSAFSAVDGSPKWQMSVGDAVTGFCEAPNGFVGVLTADQKLTTVLVTQGIMADDTGSRSECIPLDHDREGGNTSIQKRDPGRVRIDRPIENFVGRGAYQLGDGPIVVTGHGKRGDIFPRIAVVEHDRVLWDSVVPSYQQEKSKRDAPKYVDFDEELLGVAFAPVTARDVYRVAAFRLRSGERVFEAKLPTSAPASSIQVVGQRIFVSTKGCLTAFDARTGAQLFSYGASRE